MRLYILTGIALVLITFFSFVLFFKVESKAIKSINENRINYSNKYSAEVKPLKSNECL